MNVVSFVNALHRFWWLGIGVLVACVVAGSLLAFGPEERFRAESTVVVLPSEELGSNIQGIRFVLPSLTQQVQTPEVFDAVQNSLPAELQDATWDIEVTTDAESLLMFVTAESTDRSVVVPVANRFAQQIITSQADDRLVDYQILEPAAAVESNAGARSVIFVASLALGVILGALAMLTAQALSPRVVRAEDVRRLGLGMLAEIPTDKDLPRRPAEVFGAAEHEAVAEAFERLRIGLDARRSRGRPGPGVAVCAVTAGEGVTSVTANLAWAIASVGQTATAIDANLRDPDLHARFGLPNGGGLATGEPIRDPGTIARLADLPALSIVTAGVPDRHPSEPVFANLPPLLGDLASTDDVVVVDAPPTSTAPEAIVVASTTRSVILVVRAGRHSPAEVERAAQELTESGAEILGVVINRSPSVPWRRRRTRREPSARRRPARRESRPSGDDGAGPGAGDDRVPASGRSGGSR